MRDEIDRLTQLMRGAKAGRGMTNEDLADATGGWVSASAWGARLRNVAGMSLKAYLDFCDACGASPGRMMSDACRESDHSLDP